MVDTVCFTVYLSRSNTYYFLLCNLPPDKCLWPLEGLIEVHEEMEKILPSEREKMTKYLLCILIQLLFRSLRTPHRGKWCSGRMCSVSSPSSHSNKAHIVCASIWRVTYFPRSKFSGYVFAKMNVKFVKGYEACWGSLKAVIVPPFHCSILYKGQDMVAS